MSAEPRTHAVAPVRRYRHVLVAYDGTRHSRAALERVPGLVSPDTDVTVITVVPELAAGANVGLLEHADREWQRDRLTEAAAYLDACGVDATVEPRTGTPSAAIRETAQSLGSDLVVLGGGSGGRWHPSLRRHPVVPTLQKELACDTLVVRDEPEARRGGSARS
jgi:nucleotide-binding universal stress UspA family protein